MHTTESKQSRTEQSQKLKRQNEQQLIMSELSGNTTKSMLLRSSMSVQKIKAEQDEMA